MPESTEAKRLWNQDQVTCAGLTVAPIPWRTHGDALTPWYMPCIRSCYFQAGLLSTCGLPSCIWPARGSECSAFPSHSTRNKKVSAQPQYPQLLIPWTLASLGVSRLVLNAPNSTLSRIYGISIEHRQEWPGCCCCCCFSMLWGG